MKEPLEKKKIKQYTPLFNFKDPLKRYDVIVIGSGIGGMSCAAALAKYNYKVLLLEQHYVPGGFTHSFSRKGYKWDVGVHCLGEMSEERVPAKLLAWLGNHEIKMEPLGEIYEKFTFPQNFKIDYPSDPEQFKKNLLAAFPEEKSAIFQYFTLVKEAAKAARKIFLFKSFPLWLEEVCTKVSKIKGKNWWCKTTEEILNQLTNNTQLQTVLSAIWGYYGSIPKESSFGIHALVVRHFWHGGYYPKGGSSTIANALLKTIKEAGGHSIVRAKVKELILEDKKVTGVCLVNDQKYYAKKVVSAIGAKATINSLLQKEDKKTPWAQDILSLKQSPSYICLYLGFKGDIRKYGATKANQWYFKNWSMDTALWNLKQDKDAPILYISFPSLKDPTLSKNKEIKHTGEVVTFVSWEDFNKWEKTTRGKRPEAYLEYKKTIELRLIEQLKTIFPKLMEQLDFCELSTPLSACHYTQATYGSIYGLAASPERFNSKHLRTRTPIKNLYLTGGDVASLGVVGALVGGILTAGSIDLRVLKKLI